MTIPAVILAGGLSRRMGAGDKCLLPLGAGTVLDPVLAGLRPQAGPLMLNANGDPARFARFALPVCADSVPGFLGPLAGILTAMRWAAGIGAAEVATVAADMPFLPKDLIARLKDAAGGGIAIAESGGRAHPLAGVWPVTLADRLEQDLGDGQRRVLGWLAAVEFRSVSFAHAENFRNLNAIADWREAFRQTAIATTPHSLPLPAG
jgi:molybdopterin-guanine dinucleotide biosynthesis protein A